MTDLRHGEFAMWVGLVVLAVAFGAGVARRRTFPAARPSWPVC